jgi:hypothetical protein
MAEDDRLLRELYAESMARPREGHPDEAAWEAMALGELPRARQEDLTDHVARCAECAAIYRGLTLLASEAAAFDPAVPRPTPAPRVLSWPKRWVYGGLAAAAAMVLVTLLPGRRSGTPPTPGAATSDDPVRSTEKAAPVPLEPEGRLAGPPRAFRWRGIPGGVRYRVEVSRRDGELLWASPPVEGNSVEWPASVAPAPGTYYWQVIALPDADRPLSTTVPSPLVSFEVPAQP